MTLVLPNQLPYIGQYEQQERLQDINRGVQYKRIRLIDRPIEGNTYRRTKRDMTGMTGTIELALESYISERNKPILVKEKEILHEYAILLTQSSTYYRVEEKWSKEQYELSLYRTDKNDNKNHMNMTCYGEERLHLHIEIRKIKYTQYQVEKNIYQIFTHKSVNRYMTRIYNIENEQYVYQVTELKRQFKPKYRNYVMHDLDDKENLDDVNNEERDDDREDIRYMWEAEEYVEIDDYIEDIRFQAGIEIIKAKDIRIERSIENGMTRLTITKMVLNGKLRIDVIASLLENRRMKELIKMDYEGAMKLINRKNQLLTDTDYIHICVNNLNITIYNRKQVCLKNEVVFDGYSKIVKRNELLLVSGNDGLYVNEYATKNKNICDIYVDKIDEVYDELKIVVPIFFRNRKDKDFREQYITSLYDKHEFARIEEEVLIIHYYDKQGRLVMIKKEDMTTQTIEQIIYNSETGREISIIIKEEDEMKVICKHEDYKIECTKGSMKTEKVIYRYSDEEEVFRGKICVYRSERSQLKATDREPVIDVEEVMEYMCKLIDGECKKLGIDNNDKKTSINKLGVKIGLDKIGLDKKECDIPDYEIVNTGSVKYEFMYSCASENPLDMLITNGNTGSTKKIDNKKIDKMVVTKNENGKTTSIEHHEYNKNGNEDGNSSIDEHNMWKVKSVKKKDLDKGKIGWKAARTHDGGLCIVKLLIPHDAKVACDKYKDKYRTNKAVVLSIKPIVYNKNNHYYMKDLELDECPICMDANATHLSLPCRHKMCGECWASILLKSPNNECPYCKQKVETVEHVDAYQDIEETITEAYSCVYRDDFVYRLGQEVTVTNFDGNLKKVCAPGIHYELKENDVFKWFEYIDIPAECVETKVPWASLIKHQTSTDIDITLQEIEDDRRLEEDDEDKSTLIKHQTSADIDIILQEIEDNRRLGENDKDKSIFDI